MTLDEAIKQCEEAAEDRDKLCKRCDDASGYSRSHNESIRTNDAKEYEKCSQDFRQLAEWLRELKAYKEQEPCNSCCGGDQKEKAKLCQKSYLAGLEHRQEPCADAISRADVIKMIENAQIISDGEYCGYCTDDINIDALPSVTPKQKTGKWIPVSESLPELDDDGYSTYVLVSFSNFTLPCIGQLRKTDGENHWYEGDDEKALDSFGLHVNAWMPLPEPYKAESEGKE
jgi:hypothetical protein